MSFSSELKDEAARLPLGPACCTLAELAGLLGACGSIQLLGGGQFSVTLKTEHAPTARRMILLLEAGLDARPELHTHHTKRLGGRSSYALTLSGEASTRVLTACGILRTDAQGHMQLIRSVPPSLRTHKGCRHAFLRGAFLACGSMPSPDKEYHLEFVVTDDHFADSLVQVLGRSALRGKKVRRKNMIVVYLKEAEQIVTLLAQIGAHSALLTLESVRVEKELRNAVNRAVNCDSANLSKTVDASQRQVEAIEALQRHQALERLSPQLREIAEARLAHREASLGELGDLLDPPIGKSGVNHRMRRLLTLAEPYLR